MINGIPRVIQINGLEKVVLKMWKSKREWGNYRVLNPSFKKNKRKEKIKGCREIVEAHADLSESVCFLNSNVMTSWLQFSRRMLVSNSHPLPFKCIPNLEERMVPYRTESSGSESSNFSWYTIQVNESTVQQLPAGTHQLAAASSLLTLVECWDSP